MTKTAKDHLTSGRIWKRVIFMALFVLIYYIAEFLVLLTALFQLLIALFTGKVNEALLRFSKNLAAFIREIYDFLTFNTDAHPYPFGDWPNEQPGGEQWLTDQDDPAPPANPTPPTNPGPPAAPMPPANPAPPANPSPPAAPGPSAGPGPSGGGGGGTNS